MDALADVAAVVADGAATVEDVRVVAEAVDADLDCVAVVAEELAFAGFVGVVALAVVLTEAPQGVRVGAG